MKGSTMANMEKLALVVGASRGLGRGLVEELASQGWQVTATVRKQEDTGPLRAISDKVHPEIVDIDDVSTVDALVSRLAGQYFDLVFVNAGVIGPKHQSTDLVTSAELAQLFQTNAVSPIRLAHKLLGQIKPQGVLAFMTSYMGSVADNTTGGSVLYRASKAALNSLTRSLAAEIADRPITLLSVHPGWVQTDMGGAGAPLDVATSTDGIVEQITRFAGSGGHHFINYKGDALPW
jgi:NAD(P)-dependent dehydrogenase (short-subunit alcohol dehydrogenase family)